MSAIVWFGHHVQFVHVHRLDGYISEHKLAVDRTEMRQTYSNSEIDVFLDSCMQFKESHNILFVQIKEEEKMSWE